MQDWAATWGINGLMVVGFLYLIAFVCRKDKKFLHFALAFFLILAMAGTFPFEQSICR